LMIADRRLTLLVGVRHGRDIHINTAYVLLLAYTFMRALLACWIR